MPETIAKDNVAYDGEDNAKDIAKMTSRDHAKHNVEDNVEVNAKQTAEEKLKRNECQMKGYRQCRRQR